jgi:transposase-like protein
MSKTPITSEKRHEIVTALEANPNASQVARKVGGVSVTKVWEIAKSEKIALAASHSKKPVDAAPPAPPIPSKTRQQIVTALKTNPRPPVGEIARQAGVRRVTVWQIAKAEKIDLQAVSATTQQNNGHIQSNPPGHPPSIPQEKREQVLAALKADPNAAAIARKIGGVSSTTVRGIAKAAGIELTGGKEMRQLFLGPKLSTDTREKIVALLGANESVQSIGEKIGVSGTTIRTIAKAERERTTTTSAELPVGQPPARPITMVEGNVHQVAAAALSALAEKSIGETFKEAADLFGRVSRNMPKREFRRELLKLVRQFDKKPSGAG